MYEHLLVPLDASPLAIVLTERAVALAKATGARISFLHVRGDLSSQGDGVLLHALSPTLFDQAATGNASVLVARAEGAARAVGVDSRALVVTSDRPAEAIVQAAHENGADLIAMASHGRRKGLKAAFVGSVTRQVLETACLPVLVMAVETQLAQRSDEQRALAVLREEHCSLAAVLQALKASLEAGDAADLAARVQAYAQQQWRHMAHEEKVVLPAASHHRLPEDWRAIAEAFEANADPLQGDSGSFDRLASRLLDLARRH